MFSVHMGAPRSVKGQQQLKTVLKYLGKNSIPRIQSLHSFRFGDTTVRSIGAFEFAVKVPPPRRHMFLLMDIVPVGIQDLLGLEFLNSEQLYADNVTNRLVHRQIVSVPGANLECEK